MTLLQAHLDMVCEKDEHTTHNFDSDPIQLVRKDDWLKADGTTLGADNGIGVAAALAVMESSDLAHGPLEFVFTIDEETGLTGASQFTPGFLKSKHYLNLDNEETWLHSARRLLIRTVPTSACKSYRGKFLELPENGPGDVITKASGPARDRLYAV
jgi:di/tripeptidase